MGTRNITKVKYNNKTIIRQYGQWDGHPTTAGCYLSDLLKEDDLTWLKDLVDTNKIKYLSDKDIDDWSEGPSLEHFVGYYPGVFGAMNKWRYDNNKELREKTEEEKWQAFIDKFGYHDTAMYLATTRDTGWTILSALKFLHSLEESKVFLPVYIDRYDGFDIEAHYTIDLDNPDKLLTIRWHDLDPVSFSKDDLPNEKTLQELEEKD